MPALVKHHLTLNYARMERWASKQALPRDAALGTPWLHGASSEADILEYLYL